MPGFFRAPSFSIVASAEIKQAGEKPPVFMLLALIAASFLVYANSLDNAFISDDITTIARNPLLASPARFLLNPSMLLMSLNFLAAGAGPFVYHLTNVLLHCLNVVLAFFFLRTFFSRPASFLGALVFAVHPIHTEAVAWVSGRPYLVIAAFLFSNFLIYQRAFGGNNFRRGPYILSLCVFSYTILGSFGFYLLFPALVILFDLTSGTWRARWKFWIPFMAVLGLKFLFVQAPFIARARSLASQTGSDVSWNNPLLTAAHSVYSNLAILFWPGNLSLFHETLRVEKAALAFETILLFALLALLPFLFKKAKAVFFGLAVFMLFLLPTYSPVAICCLVGERYLYFSAILVGICLAFLYEKYAVRNSTYMRLFTLFFLVVVFALSLRTMVRNEDWQDEISFWSASLKASPDNPRVQVKMGDLYRQAGKFQDALSFFEKALAMSPQDALTHNNLGVTYAQMGRRDDAAAAYRKALGIKPDLAEAHFNLGNLFLAEKKYDDALLSYRRALEANPFLAEAYVNSGVAHMNSGSPQEAVRNYQKALELFPQHIVAHANLAVAYYEIGQYRLAQEHFRRASVLGYRFNPEFARKLALAQEDAGLEPAELH